jgi:hypothetical protein
MQQTFNFSVLNFFFKNTTKLVDILLWKLYFSNANTFENIKYISIVQKKLYY